MKNTIFILLLVITFFASCKKSTKTLLIQKLEKIYSEKPPSPKSINLNNVVDFKWNRLYIFEGWTTADSIERAIKLKYNKDDVPDNHSRMIFTFGDKIVHEEDFKSQDYNTSTIAFLTSNNDMLYTGSQYLNPDNAIFKVERFLPKHNCKSCFFYSLILTTSQSDRNSL